MSEFLVGLRSRCGAAVAAAVQAIPRCDSRLACFLDAGICTNYYCGRGYQTYCISESDLLNFRNIIMTRFESLATRQATCWSQVLMCGSRAVLVMMRDDDGGFFPHSLALLQRRTTTPSSCWFTASGARNSFCFPALLSAVSRANRQTRLRMPRWIGARESETTCSRARIDQ